MWYLFHQKFVFLTDKKHKLFFYFGNNYTWWLQNPRNKKILAKKLYARCSELGNFARVIFHVCNKGGSKTPNDDEWYEHVTTESYEPCINRTVNVNS